MLTALQTVMHWRRWSACADHNDWVETSGRLSPDAASTRDHSIYHKLVWRAAEAGALQHHRAVTAGDLRHGSYLVATTRVPGWPASARPIDSIKDLDNRSFTRLLDLWGDGRDKAGLLLDPDCLTSALSWENPGEDARRRLLVAISRCVRGDAYVRHLCAAIFGTRQYENLDTAQLRGLHDKLRARAAAFHHPAGQPF